MDLLWLNSKPVLIVVCTHTNFGNATWLISKAAKDIWLAFLHFWSTVYIGHPNRIRSDRENGVNSALFHGLITTNRKELQISPVEAHSAIGTGERYHAPASNILRRSPIVCYSFLAPSSHTIC